MKRYDFELWDLLPFIFVAVSILLIYASKFNSDKKARYIFYILYIFAAIRYGIGYDYYAYMKVVQHQASDLSLERFEPLSRVLVDLGYYTNYQFFFALSSFLILCPVFKSCQSLSMNPALSLVIFYLHPLFYLFGLTAVRNAIAFSLVLLAILYLTKNKLIFSFLLVVIAFLFHKSSVVAFLIFPLFYFKNKSYYHFAIYVLSFFISYIVSNIIAQYADEVFLLANAERYIEMKATEGGQTMTYIINGINILNLFFWGKLSKVEKNGAYFLGLFNVGVCIWNVFLFLDSTIATRLGLFFLQTLIIIVPYYLLIVKTKNRPKVRFCLVSFFLLLYLSYFYININAYIKNPSERMSCIPYQTVFSHEDYSNYIY